MKALFYTGVKTMELRDIPEPSPGAGEYRIRVKANGICGSDFEGYLGKTGRRTPPLIMGHEVSGIVEKVPAGGRLAEGQPVVVFPKPFCGECEFCRAGMENVCPSGICMGVMNVNGSMTEYITAAEKYLLPFDREKLSFAEAALAEPLAVAYRSVHKISDAMVAASKHCVVIGAGTIGLLIIALLKMRGAQGIIACDAQDFRLDTAGRLGACAVVNVRKGDFAETITAITGGALCDFSFEAVGIGPAAASSLDALKIGGTAVWVGNAAKIIEVNMQKIVTTELTIRGNYVYNFADFKASLKLLESKKIDVHPLMTHTYKLEDGVRAFKDLENNRDGKMLKVFLNS
ncbi:MAG: alcohol dehydrogenase catalytic domain-containing protein [Spirochaetaceae bacterium]|jgi:threonine dehydrogenase-like Zn-dependent dehydrogenase|nr:alcohol dehydrogenase catalytic domain-containing protein [Spirochaetaceae bacterium]